MRGAVAGALLVVVASSGVVAHASSSSQVDAALAALGHTTLRAPGSVPDPTKPIGADTMPGIDHIVVLMLENHTYDNLLGMLDRGNGFRLDANGNPTATNPYPDGSVQHAFHMSTTCQESARASQ